MFDNRQTIATFRRRQIRLPPSPFYISLTPNQLWVMVHETPCLFRAGKHAWYRKPLPEFHRYRSDIPARERRDLLTAVAHPLPLAAWPLHQSLSAPLTTAFVYSGLASKLAPGINKKPELSSSGFGAEREGSWFSPHSDSDIFDFQKFRNLDS